MNPLRGNAPSEQATDNERQGKNLQGNAPVAIKKRRAQDKYGNAIGKQMLPAGMKERHGENAQQTFPGMWHQAKLSQVDAEAQFHEFHNPHEDNKTGRNEQTSKKPFLFEFLFHDEIAFCNNHAFANIGKYGRPAHISFKKRPDCKQSGQKPKIMKKTITIMLRMAF